MPRLRLIVWLATAVLGCAVGSCATAQSGPPSDRLPTGAVAGDMALSPFYRWDGPLPSASGVVLRREPARDQPEATAAGEAIRLLYTSDDARWRSGQVPVSGTLFLPKGQPPAGGWPIVAWAHGTLGIADVCAPSWTGFRPRDAVYMNRWLEAGFAVVATDYQGLGGPGPHPYLFWPAEGRSVLDSVRAALAERPGAISNQVLIAGQSQGSGAALGAARLAGDYAPELRVLGVVATGLNSTFPDGPVPLPVRNAASLFLSLASGGLRDDGPAVEDILTPEGGRVLAAAREGCTREVGRLARDLGVASLADLLTIQLEELTAIRLPVTDMGPEPVPVPVMIATGLSDATIEPMRQYAAAAALCAAGTPVVWKAYQGLGHDGAMHGSFDHSLAFARALLRGEGVASNCPDLTPPGPPGALDPDAPFNDD